MNNGTIGSRWRIWDLHVHTPATYGGTYEEFIENARNSEAAVIGINDYCTLEGYKEIVSKGGISGKVIFPIVEFRMNNVVANRKQSNPITSGALINFHIIFDNDPAIFPKIDNFLNSLECFGKDGNNIQLGVVPKTDLMKLTFTFENVIKKLKELHLYEKHAIVWLPYDEYGGIDDIDPEDNFFKLSLIIRTHIIGSSTKNQINFFKGKHDRFTLQQIQEMIGEVKPCIKGSDAHKINYPFGRLCDKDSNPTDKFCWVKADMTFKGLKQIIVEPDRVFIGAEPELLIRERTNPTKFVKKLSIKNISGPSAGDPMWFDDFTIDFNSSLVAIIGNKGGGKSAITDILSLCGNTHQSTQTFSFLTKEKFRNPKPENLSDKYEASLTWRDDTESTVNLSKNPDLNKVGRIKYIPQNFLENLCTSIDPKDFEKGRLKRLRLAYVEHNLPNLWRDEGVPLFLIYVPLL